MRDGATATCCDEEKLPSKLSCPLSNSPGQPVAWSTVQALSRAPLEEEQETWLCRDRDCDLVYYGARGLELRSRDLTVTPGFKAGSDGLLCYCFGHRLADIEAALDATGKTEILESIRSEVRAGNCQCESRNPSGRCCMGEVQRAISSSVKVL